MSALGQVLALPSASLGFPVGEMGVFNLLEGRRAEREPGQGAHHRKLLLMSSKILEPALFRGRGAIPPWFSPLGAGPAPSDCLGGGPVSPLIDGLSVCLFVSTLSLPVSLCVSVSSLSISLSLSLCFSLPLSLPQPCSQTSPPAASARPGQCLWPKPPATNPDSNLPATFPSGASPGSLGSSNHIEFLSNPGSPAAQHPLFPHRVPHPAGFRWDPEA